MRIVTVYILMKTQAFEAELELLGFEEAKIYSSICKFTDYILL